MIGSARSRLSHLLTSALDMATQLFPAVGFYLLWSGRLSFVPALSSYFYSLQLYSSLKDDQMMISCCGCLLSEDSV